MLSELNKKVALLKGNRDIKSNNVKNLQTSFRKYGNLQPAMICDATKADDEGLEVVDFATGETITGEALNEYVVILDGQHRYQAYSDLTSGKVTDDKGEKVIYNKDFPVYYPLNQEAPIFSMIAEMNKVVAAWKGEDYVKCAVSVVSKPGRMVEELHNLSEMGITKLTPASMWLTLGSRITTKEMKELITDGKRSAGLKLTSNIETGKKLLEAAFEAAYEKDFLNTANFIEWIATKVCPEDEVDDAEVEKMLTFISKFPYDKVNKDIKPDKKNGIDKKVLQFQWWNELWSNM